METAESTEDHTACNLAATMKVASEKWELKPECLLVAVTDHAKNITTQLRVQKVMELPEMAKALGRAKRLVSHFNHSSKSSNILREKQRDLKHDEQCLIQSVLTRWNSAYYMLERILKQQQPLYATLIELHES